MDFWGHALGISIYFTTLTTSILSKPNVFQFVLTFYNFVSRYGYVDPDLNTEMWNSGQTILNIRFMEVFPKDKIIHNPWRHQFHLNAHGNNRICIRVHFMKDSCVKNNTYINAYYQFYIFNTINAFEMLQ